MRRTNSTVCSTAWPTKTTSKVRIAYPPPRKEAVKWKAFLCDDIDMLVHNAARIMGMGSAKERRRYIVTPPLIGWAHTQDDPWCWLPWWACFCIIARRSRSSIRERVISSSRSRRSISASRCPCCTCFRASQVSSNYKTIGSVTWRPLLGTLSWYTLITVKSLHLIKNGIPDLQMRASNICSNLFDGWIPRGLKTRILVTRVGCPCIYSNNCS